MTNVKHYFNDGANCKIQAICCLMKMAIDNISDVVYNNKEELEERNRYYDDEYCEERIEVGRYENCREQGYVFTLKYGFEDIAHYCVFEHRNSDCICLIKFKGQFTNTPTIDQIWKGRETKWDYDTSFSYSEVYECFEWLCEDMKIDLTEHINSLIK